MIQKYYRNLIHSARQFSKVLSIFGVEPPWTLNHSVHCTCAMEMSWESNRVVLPWSDSLWQTVLKSFINVVSDLSNSLYRHGRPSFMVVPEIVCSRGCSAAPLTWGMWFHVCAGASGNGCSITHSVRDLPGEASGLDSEEFTELILQ